MESLLFLGFISILKEAFIIFFKNGKITASITLFILLTKSVLYFFDFSIIKTLSTDLHIEIHLMHIATPNTPEFTNILAHIRKDLKLFIVSKCFYLIFSVVTFSLTATATILAAAIIHGGKVDLALKDLLLRTKRSWLRPLITWLYTTLLAVIYLLFLGAILITGITLALESPSGSPAGVLLHAVVFFLTLLVFVSGIVYYFYLSVIWSLALVVSAVEEIRGTEAVSKASEISKGMKLQGFLLNLFIFILSLVLVLGIYMIPTPSLAVGIIVALGIVYSAALLRVYWYAAYTVFYYRCKKAYGERVELEVSLDGYCKIPTTATSPPLLGQNIPSTATSPPLLGENIP